MSLWPQWPQMASLALSGLEWPLKLVILVRKIRIDLARFARLSQKNETFLVDFQALCIICKNLKV